MCFKKIYNKVDELKEYSVQELADLFNIKIELVEQLPREVLSTIIHDDNCPVILLINNLNDEIMKLCILHEVGHYLFDKKMYLSNKRTEENNANLFMCLFLVHNEIWDDVYFDTYLINQGIQPKIARQFNEYVWQFKYQVKYELSY